MSSQVDSPSDTQPTGTETSKHANSKSDVQFEERAKDEAKAIAQAANEAEALTRAKASSLRAKMQSSAFHSLTRIDTTMSHLNRQIYTILSTPKLTCTRLLATPSHTDALLMTTSYTLSLLHTLLSSRLRHRLNTETRALISKLGSTPLLPGEALVATISPSTTSYTYRIQTSSKALSRLIDDFRMFARLLSLIKMYAWGAATVRNPNKDRLIKSVVWGQVISCTIFQALENAAYLATKGVVELKGERIAQFYRWSSRFWAAHVLLEFVRLWRVRELRGEIGEKDSKAEAEWWRSLYVNLAWFPMTWHYSVAGGLISDSTVAALGWTAGILGLRQAWRATA